MLASWVHCFDGDAGERLHVVRGGEALEAPFVEVGAGRAMRLLRGWLADPVQRQRLLTLHEELFGRLATAGWEPGEARDRIEEDLRGAFERRALSVLGLPDLSSRTRAHRSSP